MKGKKRPTTLATQQAEPSNQSLYQQMQQHFSGDEEGFYEWLREHRLEDTSVCLGYYVQRAQYEMNWSQQDIADRTATPTEPPITRSFISLLLAGRTGIRADTWVRVADALDANPIEFFVAEKWLRPSDISAYKVPHSLLLQEVARKLEHIRPENRGAFISMVGAVADTLLIQQKHNDHRDGATPKVPSA